MYRVKASTLGRTASVALLYLLQAGCFGMCSGLHNVLLLLPQCTWRAANRSRRAQPLRHQAASPGQVI